MQSYQDIKRAGMMSVVLCHTYDIFIIICREHAQDVYKVAGGSKNCQTQTCDSSTMRRRDETYPASNCVG